MGTLRSQTLLDPQHSINGVMLGQPASDTDEDGNAIPPYSWDDSRFPSGEADADGVIVTDGDEPQTLHLLTPAETVQALATEAAAVADAEAAAVTAAEQREANIDNIPVIEQAVDELIVAVLA